MKKIHMIKKFLSILMIVGVVFAFNMFFLNKDSTQSSFEENCAQLTLMSEKTKPVISSNYENGICEFVYDGTVHQLEVSISSDQELVFYNLDLDIEESIENYFKDIGEYNMMITAVENDTYSAPDPLYITVRVLHPALVSNLSGGPIDSVEIKSDKGFCVSNSYSATNIPKSQKRAAKKSVKNKIKYEEEIIQIIKIAPNLEAQNYASVSLSIALPHNFSLQKNYRIFEYSSSGELKELTYLINLNSLDISDISTDSIIIISANKTNPYLWIWLTIASLAFVGIVVILFFYAPRKVSFYLEGSKIYVVKLNRRQTFQLSDGLENYEWYVDKNLTTKASSFGVKETSKNYYAKIKR